MAGASGGRISKQAPLGMRWAGMFAGEIANAKRLIALYEDHLAILEKGDPITELTADEVMSAPVRKLRARLLNPA